MPRHTPGDPPGAEPGRADHRLAAAVGPGAVRPDTGTGLLDGPPFVARSGQQYDSGPDHAPVRSPRIRWRTGGRAAALLCLLATVFLCWFWWQAANATAEVSPLSSINPTEAGEPEDPEPETGPSAVPDTPVAAEGDGGDGGEGDGKGDRRDTVIVHVAGAVARAGIVELPRGSRLHEAIAAAGGGAPGADPDQLNLAAVLEDGQKVLVPRQGETVPDTPDPASDASDSGARGSPDSGSTPTGKIDLNTAGAEELATLPRVGPVLAQRIVDWRKQHGNFQRVEELDAVDGFGPKLLEGLLPLVRV